MPPRKGDRAVRYVYRPRSSMTRAPFPFSEYSADARLVKGLPTLPAVRVRSIWRDEFRGIHAAGGLTMRQPSSAVHGAPVARPHAPGAGRRDARSDRVWFTHGAEQARYARSEAASLGTDGRPRPEKARTPVTRRAGSAPRRAS